MLIVALSLFGAWELVLRAREASSSAARAALALGLLLPAFIGGSLGYLCGVARDPRLELPAVLGLALFLLALCVLGGAPSRGEAPPRFCGIGPLEAAGATLFFFVVAALFGWSRA